MAEYAIVASNAFEENSPGKNRDTPLSYLKRSQHEILGEAKGGMRDDPVNCVNLIRKSQKIPHFSESVIIRIRAIDFAKRFLEHLRHVTNTTRWFETTHLCQSAPAF
jgi:hypothetical protein